mmetsp:Transcript_179/g.617  ORF Transcript_179/g.617 Transcript_179/m.617 type:complete len:214 (-) Transcript_179:68-709(-)
MAPHCPCGQAWWQVPSWPQRWWQLCTSCYVASGSVGGARKSTAWSATSRTRLQGSASSSSLVSASSPHVVWLPPLLWHSTASASLPHAAGLRLKVHVQALWQGRSLPHDLWQTIASPSLSSSWTDAGLALGHFRWHLKSPCSQAEWHAFASDTVSSNNSHCSRMLLNGQTWPCCSAGRYLSKMPSTSCCGAPGGRLPAGSDGHAREERGGPSC